MMASRRAISRRDGCKGVGCGGMSLNRCSYSRRPSWLSSLATLAASSSFSSSASSLQFPCDLSHQMILAPLTRGGNLPYRRLCASFGAQITLSEMVYARSLLKGDPIERARLRRAPNEKCFGVQIATNNVDEGRRAMELIQSARSADFVDLNVGCPIREATRRGLGSSLLRSQKLGRLVGGMAEGSDIPLSVKIRLGCEDDTINVDEVVKTLCDSGAAAITIHGRTAQQRYNRSADWERIRKAVDDNRGSGVPIIGNGDILTHYEAKRRMEESGVDAVMVGRGALTKPWIFQEHSQSRTWAPDARERVGVYHQLATYMKEHFGDDDMGKKKSFRFLPWHFEFLCRYVAFPEEEYGAASEQSPLIQSRISNNSQEELSPLDRLLSCRSKGIHHCIADALWEASSDGDAVSRLTSFAESTEFLEMQEAAGDEDGETEELANLPKRNRSDDRRRGRNPKPQRTPEEIRIIRAERAAKRAALEAAAASHGSGIEAATPSGPLTNQRGILKRWITSGRSGSFGFVGVKGAKSEYLCFEEALEEELRPIDEASLPLSIVFDTEAAEDPAKSDRAVNVRMALSAREAAVEP